MRPRRARAADHTGETTMTDTHTIGARDAHSDSARDPSLARDARDPSLARDARGRFQPGQSGNPAGKKPGTLNHATRWAHKLGDGAVDGFADQVIALANKGDFRALKFLLDRVDPKPRGCPVALAFTEEMSVLDKFIALSQAMAAGAITPDEARTAARVPDLEGRERARMLAIEQTIFRNRKTRSPREFRNAIRHLDKVFPSHLPEEEQEVSPEVLAAEAAAKAAA